MEATAPKDQFHVYGEEYELRGHNDTISGEIDYIVHVPEDRRVPRTLNGKLIELLVALGYLRVHVFHEGIFNRSSRPPTLPKQYSCLRVNIVRHNLSEPSPCPLQQPELAVSTVMPPEFTSHARVGNSVQVNALPHVGSRSRTRIRKRRTWINAISGSSDGSTLTSFSASRSPIRSRGSSSPATETAPKRKEEEDSSSSLCAQRDKIESEACWGNKRPVHCPVCWDDYQQMQAMKTDLFAAKCGHVFCGKCFSELRKKKLRCPTCRKFFGGKGNAGHKIFLP